MASQMDQTTSLGVGQQGGSQGGQDEQGGDLAKVLTVSQRMELIGILKRLMKSMLEEICDHSDAQQLRAKLREAQRFSKDGGDEGIPEEFQPDEESKSYKRLKKAPTMLEVKTEAEAFRHFCAWRDSVLLRLREVLSPSDSGDQQQPKPPDLQDNSQADKSVNELLKETKMLILRSMLLLALSLKHYNAHSRVLLLRLAYHLGLSTRDLDDQEERLAKVLLATVKKMSADEETKAKVEGSKVSRRWKVGLASVAGAALIGVTGGLAAPFVAAGIGAVMGGLGLGATVAATYLGAVAGSSVIIGGIFGAYGAKMSGRMMDRYAREVEDFAFIPIRAHGEAKAGVNDPALLDHRLRVTIGISGWLTEEQDIVEPWRVLGSDSEVFALRWEFRALVRLGNGLATIVKSAAWGVVTRQVLAGTIFSSLMSAIMWPVGLLKIARIVDNPFSVAKSRADKAGEVLADALVNRAQGERPVTLIGYSLGARVIYSCLQTLAKRRAFGLVDSAILMGAPTPSTSSYWKLMRTVVSGRLVNVYSVNDSLLGFVYRTHNMNHGIAGLQSISLSGVENFDMSDAISGHLRYQYSVGTILKTIGFSHLDTTEMQKQSDILKARDNEYEQHHAAEDDEGQRQDQSAPRAEETSPIDVRRLEREVEEKTENAVLHARFHSIQLEDREETMPRSAAAY